MPARQQRTDRVELARLDLYPPPLSILLHLFAIQRQAGYNEKVELRFGVAIVDRIGMCIGINQDTFRQRGLH